MKSTVTLTANDGPPLEELWVWITRDEDGNENAIAGMLPTVGWTQLMTGNPKTFEVFKLLADDVRIAVKGTGQTVHLLHFTNREEIEGW